MKMVIFTDLDGSLLNQRDYSFADAKPAIERIGQLGVSLIMTTSKTRREVERLQQEVGLREPFIVENGGGLFIPNGYPGLNVSDEGVHWDDYTVIVMGTAYSRIRTFVQEIKKRFSIKGFGDLSIAEVAELTGLPEEKAELAREREFTETFLLERPEDLGPLSALAAAQGLRVTHGGRFHHLMGAGQDKGKAIRRFCELFQQNAGAGLKTIGLGDSENDLAMLEAVDVPVLIPRPEKGFMDIQLTGMIRAPHAGARGWNDVVLMLLDEYREVNTERFQKG